jgi:hypothetical protein
MDQQDLINKLLIQQAMNQNQQPSFMGLQAPQDQSAVAGVLAKLKQQQVLDQANVPTPGPYGYLHDAGKAAFNSIGSNLGGQLAALGNGSVQPAPQPQGPAFTMPPPAVDASGNPAQNLAPPVPIPNAGATPQQSMTNMVMAAKAYYASQVSNGIDPDQAKVNTAQALVKWGAPNSDEILDKANEQLLKNSQTRASTTKDTSQAASADSEVQDRTLKQARETAQFIPRPDLSNSEYLAQQDPNTGKIDYTKRGDKMPPPPLTPQADAARDTIAQKIANYDLQLSTAAGRGGPEMRQDLLTRAIALNPDYDEKNFKQSADALKAYGPSGTQGQLVLKTQNAMNHLAALDEYGKALKNGDATKANQIANYLSGQFGGVPITTYQSVAPIVANEVSGAIVKGGGGVDEREQRVQALSGNLGDAARSGAINGMRSLLGAQYKNNQNLYEKTTLRKDFQDRFPVEGGFPAPPGVPSQATAATPLPTTNAQGWTLQQDAKGNKAYVSPDGKQVQEVK